MRKHTTAQIEVQKTKRAENARGEIKPIEVPEEKATETTEQTKAHALTTAQGTNVVDAISNVSPVILAVDYSAGSGDSYAAFILRWLVYGVNTKTKQRF